MVEIKPEEFYQLANLELLRRTYVLAISRLEEADAETIFSLIERVLELDARGRRHLYWVPQAPPGRGWCPVCGLPIVRRRRDAIFCSRRCGATARQRRRRGKKALSEMGALSRLPYLGGVTPWERPPLVAAPRSRLPPPP